ncbi:MAG TPA: S9 family peptidase [Terriglobales bacterium]|nr:S9 family peptidase [Terriglobales bacterium]
MHQPVSKDFIVSNPDPPVREYRNHPRVELLNWLTARPRLWTLVWSAALIAYPGGPVRAQSSTVAETLRREFIEHAFAVKSFGPARWLNGGQAYTTLEVSLEATGGNELARYDSATGQREVQVSAKQLTPSGSKEPLKIEDYAWSNDLTRLLIYTNSKRVWRANTRGDYWVLDRPSGNLRKIGDGGPPSSLMFAKFSPDSSKVAYVRFNNIYVEDLDSGRSWRLTSDGSEKIINGTSDWVYEEEFGVRDAFRWSPDGTRIAYWQFDTSKVKTFALIYDTGAPYQVLAKIPYPEYDVYPIVRQIPYPQPGTENSAVRVGVVPAGGGETRWMQVPGYPDQNYIARMEWADSGTLILQHLNRLQNTDDVLLADVKTGEVRSSFQDHDAAWVEVVDHVHWVHDGRDFLWVSERDGWRHVYLVSRDGKQVTLATPGHFDVMDLLGTDPEQKWLYYIASPDNPTQRYLYRVRLGATASPERLTPTNQPGTHAYNISPDFHWALHTYSTFDSPPTTDLLRLSDQQPQRVLEDNAKLREQVKDLIRAPTEFFRVDIGDGVVLDAWLMKPKNFDPSKKYPLLIYVYGEPASQTVVDRWDDWNGIFHRAMTQDGYVVASIDNRGTPAPRGRDWRKIVYGRVGELSAKEQALALQALERSRPYLDPARVAVWGRSGGGSNTLNLMFRHPDLYQVGMSVAPVPDQRLYDTIYQERYMGLPQSNPEGYKAGSPINFAEGLRGPLLVVHGSGDDNVHYQGTELLVNRLVELGKPFDFMTYPGRTHALAEGPGTAFHLYSLLARYLEEHVQPSAAAR